MLVLRVGGRAAVGGAVGVADEDEEELESDDAGGIGSSADEAGVAAPTFSSLGAVGEREVFVRRTRMRSC